MIKLEASRYGTLQPTFYLATMFTLGASERTIRAALYSLAAKLETATALLAVDPGWVVTVDIDQRCVMLELVKGSRREADAGMALLRSVERA